MLFGFPIRRSLTICSFPQALLTRNIHIPIETTSIALAVMHSNPGCIGMCFQQEYIDIQKDSKFLQRLQTTEGWVDLIKELLDSLDNKYGSDFHFGYLREMTRTSLNSVQMMRSIEVERTRLLHGKLDDLEQIIYNIQTMVEQFDKVEQADTVCETANCKRSNKEKGTR